MLQISTAELAVKAEETRGQLRHLDQQVGHLHTHQPGLHPFADEGLNVTELVES